MLTLFVSAIPSPLAQQPTAGIGKIEPYIFKAANGETAEAERGTLYVPENRTKPNSRLIELAFIRIKSRSTSPGVPTIYLVGGPGGNAVQQVTLLFSNYSHILQTGDLVVLDQRGTGNSKPNLKCDEKVIYPLDKPIETTEFLRLTREASDSCARSLRAKGIDLNGYNTNENADDVDALRRALKIEKWNLFGTSYGTHLSFAVIRRHKESLNRVVIGGVEGPDHTYKLPNQIDRNFADIQDLVRKDPDMGKILPNLIDTIRAISARLEKQPVTTEILDPETKQQVKILLGKLDFQFFLATFPGRVVRIRTLPASIHAMEKGDYGELARISLAIRREALGSAMSFMMDCSSGVSPSRMKTIKKEEPGSLVGGIIDFPFPGVCAPWRATDLGPAFRSPIRASIPVLFISGALDGRTPASNVEEIRKGFPNSHHLIVENAGHVDTTMFTPKTKELMVEFLKGKSLSIDKVPADPLAFAPLK